MYIRYDKGLFAYLLSRIKDHYHRGGFLYVVYRGIAYIIWGIRTYNLGYALLDRFRSKRYINKECKYNELKLELGRLKLLIDNTGPSIALYWSGVELTKNCGFITAIGNKVFKRYYSPQAFWEVDQSSSKQVDITLRWRGFPVEQRWQITLEEEKTIKWDIWIIPKRKITLAEKEAGIMLSEDYTRWLNSYEEGDFFEIDPQQKEWEDMKLWNLSSKSIGVRSSVKNGEFKPAIIVDFKETRLDTEPKIRNSDYRANLRTLLVQVKASYPLQRYNMGRRYNIFSSKIKIIEDEEVVNQHIIECKKRLYRERVPFIEEKMPRRYLSKILKPIDILLVNLPWKETNRWGVRAGSRWPHIKTQGEEVYLPFPFLLAYTASVLLEHGANVRIIDAIAENMEPANFINLVDELEPMLLIAEVSTPSLKYDLNILRQINKGNTKIAVCGPDFNIRQPEFLKENNFIDFVMVGEYEYIALELFNHIKSGKNLKEVLGLIYRENGNIKINPPRPLIDDLDKLPWPLREQLPMERYMDAPGKIPYPSVQMWACYDKETEILTKDGWKKFAELSYSDEIASLNLKTLELEYQNPTQIFIYYYEGKLFRIKSAQIDLLITPNHKVLADKSRRGKFELVEIKKLITKKHFEFKKDAIWKGKEQKYFILPSVKFRRNRRGGLSKVIQARKILMDTWLEFFGYFISEGNFSKRSNNRYIIKISQSKESKAWNDIKKVIEKIGFSYCVVKRNGKEVGFEISNKQLFYYLKQFGKVYDRFIPKEIKGLSKRQLLILLNALMLGDGCFEDGGRVWSYTSSSKRLIDDIQEILLKVGFSGNIKVRGIKNHPVFRIRFNKHQNTPRLNHSKTSQHIKLENYKGNVFCCEIPNHIIYVRRNGKACWSGNSRGCPFQCTFCLWPQLIYNSNRYRMRGAKFVVDEMEYLVKERGFKSVYFDDDTFNISKERILKFCQEIKERGLENIPWAIMARADTMDEEMLTEMRSAGLHAVKYGIESAEQKLLDNVGKNLNLKQAERMIRFTKSLGIKTHLTFAFGLPGETKETIKRTIDYIIELDPDTVQFSIMTPYPGTEYYKQLDAKGYIISKDWSDYDGASKSVIRTEYLSGKDLEKAKEEALKIWKRHKRRRRTFITMPFDTELRMAFKNNLKSKGLLPTLLKTLRYIFNL